MKAMTVKTTCALFFLALGTAAYAETVVPMKGQTPERIQYENYDKVNSEVQQEYRQEQAKDAAVGGAVVGGANQRQNRRRGSSTSTRRRRRSRKTSSPQS
jgi:hypothetical protein